MNTVQVRDITFGDGTLVLIAGPCVIESRTTPCSWPKP